MRDDRRLPIATVSPCCFLSIRVIFVASSVAKDSSGPIQDPAEFTVLRPGFETPG